MLSLWGNPPERRHCRGGPRCHRGRGRGRGGGGGAPGLEELLDQDGLLLLEVGDEVALLPDLLRQ